MLKTQVRTTGDYEWWTPPAIVSSLGEFDLDPCAGSPRPWDTAKAHYGELGLLQNWHGRVWLNPPYGKEISEWLLRMANHGNGVALVFARTGAPWFHDYIWKAATGVLFLRHRIYFHDQRGERATTNAGSDACLVSYGDNVGSLADCGMEGHLVRLGGSNGET